MSLEKLIYFGDSLTDISNLADANDATPGAPPAASNPRLGPERAVTNAFTHAQYTTDLLDVEQVNYAVAGARALGTQTPFAILGNPFDLNFSAQIDRFEADAGSMDLTDSNAVILIGANDFSDLVGSVSEPTIEGLLQLQADAVTLGAELIAALGDAAGTLQAAGVGTTWLASQPLSSFYPTSDVLPDVLTNLADTLLQSYNDSLSDAIDLLNAAGGSVRLLDFEPISEAVTEDPESIGIIAPRNAWLVPDAALSQDERDFGVFSVAGGAVDGDQVAFWDALHPGQAIHEAWGAYSDFIISGGDLTEGSSEDDRQRLTTAEDLFLGLGGDDRLIARAGDDVALGGSGNDRLEGRQGNDILIGGSGDDTLQGGKNADILQGNGGNDQLFGGLGPDLLIGGTGGDSLLGGPRADTLVFVEPSLLTFQTPDVVATETTSIDKYDGGKGNDTLILALGADSFAAYGADINAGNTEAAFTALGITATRIGTILAVEGREGLRDELSDHRWFVESDAWGII